MRQRYKVCNHCGEVLPIEQCYEHEGRFQPNEAHLISQDTMPATEHPVTGQVFESKSAFRRTTKALGYEEIGNSYTKEQIQKRTTKDAFDNQRERKEYLADVRADLTRQLAKWGY